MANNNNSLIMNAIRLWFRSVAQVMFQANAWCGVLLLAGIFWGAYSAGTPEVAWGAVVGTTVAILTGCLLGYPRDEATQGLWGFNGILVGCALMTFLGSTPLGWAALVVCAAMTTWVRVGLNRLGEPLGVSSYTFPFVLSTWIFLAAARMLGGIDIVALAHPMLPSSFVHTHLSHDSLPTLLEFCQWTLRGVSQVFLIDSWLTGALFVVGLAIARPAAALWAVVGSAGGAAVALLFGAPTEAIAHGMYGFSPVLTAIALGTLAPTRAPLRRAVWALVGIVGTVFVQASMNELLAPVGLPSLTAPFCIATWLFMLPIANNHKPTKKD